MRIASKPSSFLLAALLAVAFFPGPSQARPDWKARSYERWVKPHPLSISERKAIRITRQWAKENRHYLGYEPRLGRASRLMMRDVPEDGALDSSRAKLFAHYWGITDGEYAVTRLKLSPTDNLKSKLRKHLNREFKIFPYNRVGLSMSSHSNSPTILFIFSRHGVHLVPTPSRKGIKRKVMLRGRFAPHKTIRSAQVVLSKPDGTILKQNLKLTEKSFAHPIYTGTQAGIMDVQILLDRGSGPQIAAHFPIGVSHPPWAPSITSQVPTVEHAQKSPSDALAALILGTRRANEVGLLARSSALDAIANGHATDMIEKTFFAHTSPRTGNLTHRLKKAGILVERGLENIAIADDVNEILKQWLQSPSHRKNIIDPNVTTFGVAVKQTDKATHNSLTAVLVLARLGDQGSTAALTQRAYDVLNTARRKLGLGELRVNNSLEKLAVVHSQIMGDRKKLRTNHPNSGDLMDRIMEETTAEESAANIYRTTTLEPLKESSHLKDTFLEVGVGIYQAHSRKSAPFWVTVIYATP